MEHFEFIENIAMRLAALGHSVTFEYPGYLDIDLGDGRCLYVATANQVWESRIVDAEGRDLGSMLTEIPWFVTDVDAIVSAIEGHIRQAREGHEKA